MNLDQKKSSLPTEFVKKQMWEHRIAEESFYACNKEDLWL